MAVECLMKKGATEAYKHLDAALGKVNEVRHAPQEASREAIDKRLDAAITEMGKAREWIYAIEYA